MVQTKSPASGASGASSSSGSPAPAAAGGASAALRGKDLAAQDAAVKPPEAKAPGSRKIFRGMKEAGGRPQAGESARELGVRPGDDIPVTAGMVNPETGGMSTAPDDPKNLPEHRRGPEHGGTGKDPVWEADAAAIANDVITWRQDKPKHGNVEPKKAMKYGEYKAALEATAGLWAKVPAKPKEK